MRERQYNQAEYNRDSRSQNETASSIEARKPFAFGLIAVILMGVFGLGAGWFAGKALSGALQPAASSDGAESNDAPAPPIEIKAPPAQPPVVEAPREEKSEEAKAPRRDDEQVSVERLGRKALRKIMKEIEGKMDNDKPREKRKGKKEH